MDNTNRDRTIKQWGGLLLVVVLLVSFVYLVLAIVGYGKLAVTTNSGEKIYINGRLLQSGTLKVRPGTYAIQISAPDYTTTPKTIHVKPFQTVAISDTIFAKRDPNAIARSVMGGYGGFGAPSLVGAKFFENNTWMAAVIGPGSAQPIVFHYDNGVWSIYYYSDPGYSHDLSDLPIDVSAYVQQLMGQFQNG